MVLGKVGTLSREKSRVGQNLHNSEHIPHPARNRYCRPCLTSDLVGRRYILSCLGMMLVDKDKRVLYVGDPPSLITTILHLLRFGNSVIAF